MERLQKVIARAGLCSRRKAEELIALGRVRVNGQVVSSPGAKVDPASDRVEVDGRPLRAEPFVYYLLNKPMGAVTTASDPQGRPTVVELLSEVPYRIFPVGRLDWDTAGLLLMTNDGDLAYRLTHPKFEVEKVYVADVAGAVGPGALARLRQGVELDDGRTAPARARVLARGEGFTRIELVIHEGRNRQVRRMAEAVGHPVRRLVRVGLGPLELGDLAPGAYRPLRPDEVAALRRITGKGATGRRNSPVRDE